MDFLGFLKESKQGVEEQLNAILLQWRKEVLKISPKLVHLADLFIDSCQGGKRIRGVLVKLGYEIANGQEAAEIFKPAAAFEIFQTAILAHDDIIDQSPLRRGKPTIYQALGGDHYGISQTIGLGDVGLFLATKLIADSNFPAENKNKALSFFTRTVIDTGLGEILDVELPHLKKVPQEEDIITIFRLKTAWYTIIGPMQLGAILAGATDGKLKIIERFGQYLGIAFQIQDDILGVFGDAKTIGKSVTSDIEEGKNTLLILQALKKASTIQKGVLDKYYGKGKLTKSGLQQIRRIFINTGALDYSRQKAVQYVSEARKVIPEITKNAKMQQLLSGMADFLVKRDR